ncbi:hypothetical protein [Micromonospora craterilacus]|uniref:hypothetical protein n=1 Tax=Micromonospora craterilacus TaxID=1655439 RepID=UPI001F401D0F|nr:hypothetical protein [Micromonospora craterilacus]
MDSMSHPADEPDADRPPRLNVGDPELGKTRLLAYECATCIFKPGNPMHLEPGRLKQMVTTARGDAGYIICHSTLPYAGSPVPTAVCRGFFDRYRTWQLQVMERLWGFVEVEPPGQDADRIDGTLPTGGSGAGGAEPGSAP